MSTSVLDRPASRPKHPRCPGCQFPLRSNGSCAPCEFLAFRGSIAATEAWNRLDNTEPPNWYSTAQRHADLVVVRAWRRRRLLMESDACTPVNGCAECGRLEVDHSAVRSHGYDMPTDRLRLARLKARRALAGRN